MSCWRFVGARTWGVLARIGVPKVEEEDAVTPPCGDVPSVPLYLVMPIARKWLFLRTVLAALLLISILLYSGVFWMAVFDVETGALAPICVLFIVVSMIVLAISLLLTPSRRPFSSDIVRWRR